MDRKQRALPFGEHEVVFAGCIVLGLEAMHATQIVYEDLKPDNLLLSHAGCKLTDLGMAQAVPPRAPSAASRARAAGRPR